MIFKAGPELKLRFLWIATGYMLVVLVVFLSLTSNPINTGMSFPYEDKLYHAFAYFTLMFWFSQIYHDSFQRNMIAVVFIFMGFMLEYLQSFDPKRFAELGDMAANTAGVVMGFLLTSGGAKNILHRIEKALF